MKSADKDQLLSELAAARESLKAARKLAPASLHETLDDLLVSVDDLKDETEELPEDAESPNRCKNLRRDDWTCRPGCPKQQVARGGSCPFDEDGDAKGCACYK
jgi:predicted nuclease with TOPRIM domain